jgi:hypothetical protein
MRYAQCKPALQPPARRAGGKAPAFFRRWAANHCRQDFGATDPKVWTEHRNFLVQGNFHVVTRNLFLRINQAPSGQFPLAWP